MATHGIAYLAGLVAATCLLVEGVIRLPLKTALSEVLATSLRSLRLVSSSRISDHWKEIAILQYSKRIFRATLNLLMALTGIGAAAFVLISLADSVAPGFAGYALSGDGIVLESVTAVLYVMLRRWVAHA